MSAASTSKLGKCALGPYELEREIGADFLGRLWSARARSGSGAGVPVTIRRIAEQGSFDRAVLDEMAEAAFWAMDIEGRAFVPVKDVVGDADEVGVVFRYLEGATLRFLLRRAASNGCPIPEGVIVRIVSDVARHLTSLSAPEVRERGYAFTGIAPDSVFIERTGATRVLDTGIWAVATRRALTANPVAASLLAPEQLDGRGDPRTDVFALGMMLWEMLAMRSPRPGTSFRAEGWGAPILPYLGRLVRPGAPAVGQALGDLVARALDPEPSRRFATPYDLSAALVRIAGPVTEAEAALMLGLIRSTGVRRKAQLDVSGLSPAGSLPHEGHRVRLDTMPYPLDAEEPVLDAPPCFGEDEDESRRDTMPSFGP